jgi:hypothetical protein
LAQALANNSTLKELDVSSNVWVDEYGREKGDGPGFAQELAVGIKDNGAMTKLDLSSNDIGETDKEEQQKAVEALLQSSGTSFEALEEHFEEPADEAPSAIVNMQVVRKQDRCRDAGLITHQMDQICQSACCNPQGCCWQDSETIGPRYP